MLLLLDIGGTHMRIAISSDCQSITDHQTIDTPQNFDTFLTTLKSEVNQLSKEKITQVCAGIAGSLDINKSFLQYSPHLNQWINAPLKNSLQEIFKTQIFLENDAALAGLGEASYGAGVGKNIVAYLTISTGVGGAKIVNRQISPNSLGFEPGHQIVDQGKDLESFISGSAIEKRFGIKASEINDTHFWETVSYYTAVGVNNTIVYWSPDIVVLGGAVMDSLPISLIQANLSHLYRISHQIPPIVKAKLGDMSGLYGALEYCKQTQYLL